MVLMTSAHEKLHWGWIVSDCVEVGDGRGDSDAVGTLVVESVRDCWDGEGEDEAVVDAVYSKLSDRVAGGEVVVEGDRAAVRVSERERVQALVGVKVRNWLVVCEEGAVGVERRDDVAL